MAPQKTPKPKETTTAKTEQMLLTVLLLFSHSVMSDSFVTHGLYPARLLYPCNSPGKNTGLLCPPPGDLPIPGIEPASPALAGGSFISEPPGKPIDYITLK